MNFSAFFIRRPRFAIVISVVMVLLGLMALFVLPVSQYPDITPPQIVVQATYPGASAQVLVDTVAVPIENELNGVEGMLYMESSSDDNGVYELTITFNIGTNPDIAQVKVENRLQQVTNELPQIVTEEGLSVRTQSSNLLAMLVLRSPNRSYTDLYLSNYAYTYLKNPLSRVAGVSNVDVYGPQYSMRVWLNPDKLTSLGLDSSTVIDAIESQNIQASVGQIGAAPSPQSNKMVLTLTAKGLLNTVEDFEQIIVATSPNGGAIRLKDIGEVDLGADSYAVVAQYDNAPSVVLGFSQTPNSNALDIMKNIQKEIQKLEKNFPDDMQIDIAYDSTTFVRASISSIVDTLIITFLLVILVVFVFLQNYKATFIPMITIPVSLIATFAVIYLLGFNINILTLFAMILAVGLVVDDAIIVVERAQYLMKFEKMDAQNAAVQAMNQIGGAIVATTFVLLAIFIPVGLMAGITGKIYQQFAVTIATAVVFSAFNALTLSPALCALFLKKDDDAGFKNVFFRGFDALLDKGKSLYTQAVTAVCSHLVLMTFGLVGVIALIVGMFYILPTAFIPQEDQGIILGSVQLPENASINETQNLVNQMGEGILKMAGVDYFVSVSGASMLGAGGENIAMIVVGLKPWKDRTSASLSLDSLTQKLSQSYGHLPIADINFYSFPAIPGVGESDGLSFDILAQDLNMSSDVFYQNVVLFLEKMNQNPQFAYAFTTFRAGTPHVFLDIDRTKLQSYQASVGSLFNVLQNNLGSRYINNITLAGQINKVIIQADFNYRQSIEDVLNLYVPTATGGLVKIRNFATVKTVLSPKIIYRHNQYMSAGVVAQSAAGTSSGTAIDTVDKMSQTDLTQAESIAWTGLSLQEVETHGLAGILIGLAVVFGYLFLVALYESWLVAMAVMFSNIFAVLGAVLGLYIIGLPLSIYAQLGIVLLIGLASKNAILIVEFTLDYRRQGLSVLQSAVRGADERFRAVLMTALTFILGVFPMVVATGAGAENQRAIGTAVFFGMIMATVVGILFVPALFALFDTIAEHFGTPFKLQSPPLAPSVSKDIQKETH